MGRVRVGAIGDLHCGRASAGQLQPLLARAGSSADVLLLCGDLTDFGLEEEARLLAREISGVRTPIVAVLGNHDFESGQAEAIVAVLREAGVHVLDGDSVEIAGVGFAGVKGFGGGFGRGTLGPWGEAAVKQFVREAVDEALKLEMALARLRTAQRVAVLHYSPIRETVDGEPPDIFPFLGTSRLEEPVNRYKVDAVFHGHAHRGRPHAPTSAGIPVYNVSLPLLREIYPEFPCRFVEFEPMVEPSGGSSDTPAR